VLKTAVKELKSNRILVTECDEMEEWRPSPDRFISFLGRSTGLDRTINVLHRRTGAEAVFAVIHRHSLNKYSFIAHPLNGQRAPETSKARYRCVGSEVLKTLEWYILRFPEQWYQWKNYFSIGERISESEMPVTAGKAPAFEAPAIKLYPDRAFAPVLQQKEF